MPDTRDPFSAVFEDLADAGRTHARPLPATAIHALGRTRQKQRQRLTVATSGVVACAVAAGIAFTGTGGKSSSVPPGQVGTPTTAPAMPKTSTANFLKGTDLPDVYEWRLDVTGPADTFLDKPICGSAEQADPKGALQAVSAMDSQYRSPVSSENAHETIYRYASADAAHADFLKLRPDVDKCAAQPVPQQYQGQASRTAEAADGFGWMQSGTQTVSGGYQRTIVDHFIVVQTGNTVAVFSYREADPPQVGYDQAGDARTMATMRSRLLGLPVPDHTPGVVPTAAPALPDSAWITDKEIPFAAADKSQGWVFIEPWSQQGSGSAPTPTECKSATGSFVDGSDSIWKSRSWHGNPTTIPANPATNYLYSSANEKIHTFNTPDGAKAAFDQAGKISAAGSCSFTDDSHTLVARVVKAGPSTATGFSIAVDDRYNSTASHQHTYVVIKGNRVAELNIDFESGANNDDFSGDQAVLTAMAGHLP